MKSSLFEFEVTPFDPAWAAGKLQRAVAFLDIPDPGPGRIGQRGPSFQEMEAARLNTENAARIVRILETPEAARAMVRYLGRGPQYAQQQLRAAIFATPRRKEVLAALDVPIVQDYYFAIQQLAELANLGPLPNMTSTERVESARYYREIQGPYRERAKPFDDAVTARLITALNHKRGEALAISVATVSVRGTAMPTPASPGRCSKTSPLCRRTPSTNGSRPIGRASPLLRSSPY